MRAVGGEHLIKRDDTKAGVVRIRRDGKRDRERSDCSRHKTWNACVVRNAISPLATLAGRCLVDFPGQVIQKFIFDHFLGKRRVLAAAVLAWILQEEITLGDASGAESIRFDNIRTRFQETAVNVTDHFGVRDRVDVAVVFKVLFDVLEPCAADVGFAEVVGADGGAHRPIDDEDPFSEQAFQVSRFIVQSTHAESVNRQKAGDTVLEMDLISQAEDIMHGPGIKSRYLDMMMRYSLQSLLLHKPTLPGIFHHLLLELPGHLLIMTEGFAVEAPAAGQGTQLA